MVLQCGDAEFCLHACDDKTPAGTAGQVAYWAVEDFDKTISRALSLGATIYRGPLDIPGQNRTICQFKDHFGNVVGIDGPRMKK